MRELVYKSAYCYLFKELRFKLIYINKKLHKICDIMYNICENLPTKFHINISCIN